LSGVAWQEEAAPTITNEARDDVHEIVQGVYCEQSVRRRNAEAMNVMPIMMGASLAVIASLRRAE